MLKRILFAPVCIIAVVNVGTAQEKVHVKGELSAYGPQAVIYMEYTDQGKTVADSARLKEGKFSFTFRTKDPTQVMLMMSPDGLPMASYLTEMKAQNKQGEGAVFFADKGDFKIISADGTLSAMKVETASSFYNNEYKPYVQIIRDGNAAMKALSAEYQAAAPDKQQDTAYLAGVRGREKAINDEMYDKGLQFAKNHQGYTGLIALSRCLQYKSTDAVQLQAILGSFPEKVQFTFLGTSIRTALDVIVNTTIGKPAPQFEQKNTEGKLVKLSDFKGKYVLVDFWASWCAPCRQENPNLVHAFKAYESKGFTILGVSLDEKFTNWLEAINADGLTWTQVSDIKGFHNAVAQQYGIQFVPANFLLDPNGIIIAKNLRGPALQAKLAEILK